MRLLGRCRLRHASLARVAYSTGRARSYGTGRSLVAKTLLAIDYGVGGFLEMWIVWIRTEKCVLDRVLDRVLDVFLALRGRAPVRGGRM